MKNIFFKKIFDPSNEEEFHEKTSSVEATIKKQKIDSNLHTNVETLKSIYLIPDNSDVQIRNIDIGGINKKAIVIYISTITDLTIIQENIIQPLQKNSNDSPGIEDIVTISTVATANIFEDIVNNINKGNTILLIEDESKAFMFATSNFEGRSIEKAENEVVVKGPKEAFNEKAASNISLIRKRMKNENLIVEASIISKRSNNELFLLYVKDLTNEELLKKVKKRLEALDIDSVQNISILEELIEENKKSLFPTILYTERPDRATSFLENGHIVLVMDNSPASLILPATFWSFFHNTEDHYMRFIYGNFIRFLRLIALFITLFISAIYVSVTNYHVEMIPVDLLLAISATREIVPFPSIIEILLMEIAFELIREAGLRVPSPIGPTIGIVGALILGQAAVQANMVSPLVVIVVALGGLSSFAIGDINMNFAIRLSRFLFILAAAFFGFYGTTAVFVIGLFYLVAIKSYGVPYFAPMTPSSTSSKDTYFRRMINNEVYRPGYLKPKDMKKKAGE